jgi:hypothetical protein
MTFKAHITQAAAELAALKEAMARAKLVSGEVDIVCINDPESEELLRPFRIEGLDQTKTVEVGPAEFPGPEWYAEYQRKERERG